MFASIGKALALIFDPALFGVVLKSLLLTVLLFVVLLIGVEGALYLLPTLGEPWVNRLLAILAPVLFILGFFVLGAPVAALFGSLFLGDIAKAIEARSYAGDPKAPGATFATNLSAGARLAGLVVLADLVLLPTDVLLPGIGEVATILVNGFLLGREYFELAALRHLSVKASDALRRRHSGAVFGGGLIISVLSMIPFANLFAPLFGAALMVHLFKRYAREAQT